MRKLLIFFILFIFSSFSYSGDEVEKFVLEQHNKIFNYINTSEDLLKNDKDKFLFGLENSLQDLILSEEISIFSEISMLISAALRKPNNERTRPIRYIFCIKI